MNHSTHIILGATLLLMNPVSSFAEVIEFIDSAEWEANVGDFVTINFTEYPPGTVVTDQYRDLGILFTDGNDVIDEWSGYNDGFGLWGPAFDDVTVQFASPQSQIAVHFPGAVQFILYGDGELIYESSVFSDGYSTFAGLVSTEPFNAAVIRDPTLDGVAIDDLHFGPPIPAPGALSLLALGFIGSARRRRT
jgi:MYXO-CTERM domain-containing protein